MCGIAGWYVPPQSAPAAEELTLFARALRHRGPDDSGIYIDPKSGVGLGHRRLSIIDLSTASHQPMLAVGGQVALSYNGELYNFRELRNELEARGARFLTTGDTEVVLQAYLHWGIAAVRRFAGMFAIALWDGRTQTLHLARDAMGIKPLYWMSYRDGIAFSSEARALQALPGVTLKLRDASVSQYLEFGYVIEDDYTIFEGVHKLLPGHRVEVRDGRIAKVEQYYAPPVPDAGDDIAVDSRTTLLHDALDEVVREHLIADVPVALLLSGGIDSSVVAALAARHARVESLTMAFEGATVDERGHARRVAEFVGSRHGEVFITAEQVIDEATEHAGMFDDLFADWGTFTTRLLYRRSRELGYKVVLVGEGADELFGGYDAFQVPTQLNALARFRQYQRYAGRRHGECRALFNSVMGAYLDASGDAFDAVRLFESRQQLPNQYVMKVDKASMAESVEARAPYLDRRIADCAYRTPRAHLLHAGENKHLLRQMARQYRLLPEDICGRVKFGSPLASSWMDSNMAIRKLASERLLAPGGLTDRYGLSGAMHDYLRRGRGGMRWPGGISIYRNLAWRLLLLELWGAQTLVGGSPAASLLLPTGHGLTRTPQALDIEPGLVSVIIPVYNRSALMRRAVDSVLAQTYRSIEIIVVDDGSIDDTPAVAASLQAAHPDVVRVITQRNAGPGAARQRGVEACRGEFVQFLDSDDRYLPDKTRLLVAALHEQVNADVAYGKFFAVDGDGRRTPDPAHRNGERHQTLFPTLLQGRIWHVNNPLYRRTALARIGAWPRASQMEDWQYDALAGAAGVRLAYVDEFVAEQWHHAGDHLGKSWRRNGDAHRQRVAGFLRILDLAKVAGVNAASAEMQAFCRTLFLEARWAAAAGMADEAGALLLAAERNATSRRWQFRLFREAARLVGFRRAGRLANLFESTR